MKQFLILSIKNGIENAIIIKDGNGNNLISTEENIDKHLNLFGPKGLIKVEIKD